MNQFKQTMPLGQFDAQKMLTPEQRAAMNQPPQAPAAPQPQYAQSAQQQYAQPAQPQYAQPPATPQPPHAQPPYAQPPLQPGFDQQQSYQQPAQQQQVAAVAPGYGAPPAAPAGYGGPSPAAAYGGPSPAAAYGGPPAAAAAASGGAAADWGFSLDGFNISEIHPSNILGIVLGGGGWKAPRLMGLVMCGLSFLAFAANVALLIATNRFFPYLFILFGTFMFAGPFALLTGEPRFRGDGVQAPAWARFGLVGTFVIGLLLGIAMTAAVMWL